jgi:hypothetical protein
MLWVTLVYKVSTRLSLNYSAFFVHTVPLDFISEDYVIRKGNRRGYVRLQTSVCTTLSKDSQVLLLQNH